MKTLSRTLYLENFTIIGLQLFLSSLNVSILWVRSKSDFSTVSPSSSPIIFNVCSSVSSPFSSDIPWMRMQFRLDYCCCRSSEFFSTSISFEISVTFVFSLDIKHWEVKEYFFALGSFLEIPQGHVTATSLSTVSKNWGLIIFKSDNTNR